IFAHEHDVLVVLASPTDVSTAGRFQGQRGLGTGRSSHGRRLSSKLPDCCSGSGAWKPFHAGFWTWGAGSGQNCGMRPPQPPAALVLSGGGMRGAYEVGVVAGIVEVLDREPGEQALFDIFAGTS